MNKNRIRLTESQLHRVIKESVNKVLRESVIDLDNMNNYELTQNISLAFNTALKNASKDVEKECQELLNNDYYMYGVGDTEDEQHMTGTTYRDWLYDYLLDIVKKHIDDIY